MRLSMINRELSHRMKIKQRSIFVSILSVLTLLVCLFGTRDTFIQRSAGRQALGPRGAAMAQGEAPWAAAAPLIALHLISVGPPSTGVTFLQLPLIKWPPYFITDLLHTNNVVPFSALCIGMYTDSAIIKYIYTYPCPWLSIFNSLYRI